MITPSLRDFLEASSSIRGAENAPIAAGEPKSSSVTANEAAAMRSSPVAARWLSTPDIRMPPAQKPTVLTSGLPVISQTASMALSTRAA